MNGVFDRKESDEWGIPSTRWDIGSDILVDEWFIQFQDLIERASYEYFTNYSSTGCCDDGHISIEGEFAECIIFDDKEHLHNIRTYSIGFSMTDACML